MKTFIIVCVILFSIFAVMLSVGCCVVAGDADRREEEYLRQKNISESDGSKEAEPGS